jgi:hypothetical protein
MLGDIDVSRERWFRQLRSAVALNALDLDLWDVAWPLVDGERSPLSVEAAAAAAARYVHHVLPYKFTGTERILELRNALRRGSGACGDATAAVAACVLMVGGACDVCYERITKDTPLRLDDGSTAWDPAAGCVKPELSGYAHVRVALGDALYDAFPSESLEVLGCSGRVRITRAGVEWPLNDATALLRLDARSPPGGLLR